MDHGYERLGQAPAGRHVHDWTARAEDHDALDHGGEEEEGEGDADHRVDNTEGFASIGEWSGVAISWLKQRDMDRLVEIMSNGNVSYIKRTFKRISGS